MTKDYLAKAKDELLRALRANEMNPANIKRLEKIIGLLESLQHRV